MYGVLEPDSGVFGLEVFGASWQKVIAAEKFRKVLDVRGMQNLSGCKCRQHSCCITFGESPGFEVSRVDREQSHSYTTLHRPDCGQVCRLTCGVFGQICSGRDDSDHLTFDNAARVSFTHLFADSSPVTCLDEPSKVRVQCMVRDSCHGDFLLGVSCSEGNVER